MERAFKVFNVTVFLSLCFLIGFLTYNAWTGIQLLKRPAPCELHNNCP